MDLNFLSKLEKDYTLPAGLLNAVMMQESGGKATAVSPKGAKGWFQFMDDTAKAYDVVDPTDFYQSAQGAARYFADLSRMYNGDLPKMLAGYNAGPGNVRKHNGVPPFPETQDYVKKISMKLAQNTQLGLDLDLGEDLDLGTETAPAPAPARDWQKELDEAAGGVVNTAGQIGASILFGAGGGMAGGAVGGPIGAGVGGVAGGAAGNAAALWIQLRNHEAPVEEKLEYLAKQGALDLAIGGAIPIAGKGISAVRKLLGKSDADKAAIEAWFKKRGQEVSPTTSIGAGAARSSYGNTADRMDNVIKDEIAAVQSRLSTAAPDAIGHTFQTSRKEANERLTDLGKTLFAPFAKSTPLGSVGVDTHAIGTVADEALKTINKRLGSVASGENKSATITFLEDLAKGKRMSVEELVERKRGLDNIIDFDVGDVARSSFEGSKKLELRQAIDDSIKDALVKAGGPGAAAQYASANAIYSRSMGNLNNDLLKSIMEKDPLQVVEAVASKITPDNVKILREGLARMVQLKALPRAEYHNIMDATRRKWLEKNFNTPDQAANVMNSMMGRSNLEQKRAFESLFDTPKLRNELLDIARASKGVNDMLEHLPKRESGMAGAYSAAGSIGSATMGAPGAAGVLGVLYAMTGIPKAAAHAASTGDVGVVNQAKFALNWIAKQKPETWSNAKAGALVSIPPAVLVASQNVLQWAAEQGLDKLNESFGIPQ